MDMSLLSKTENKIWDIPKINLTDDSIVSYEFDTIYDDSHGTGTLQNTRQFSMSTNNEDRLYVPSQGYLLLTLKLRKTDNTEYRWVKQNAVPERGTAGQPGYHAAIAEINIDNITLCNNGFNIFEEARYYIDDNEVEMIDHLGIATLINNLINQSSENDLQSIKHSRLWFLKEDEIKTYLINCKGDIQLQLPLREIFPFCKTFDHIFRGSKHRITLRLKDSNALIKRNATVPEGKVFIEKMVLKIPHVEPSLEMMVKLESLFAKSSSFTLTWPAVNTYRIQPDLNQKVVRQSISSSIHKPTDIFIACQSLANTNSQTTNDMEFIQNNIEEVFVEVNNKRFPDRPIENNADLYSGSIEVFNRFLKSCKNETGISYIQFKSHYPIYHIDVSKHKAEIYDTSTFPDIVVNLKLKNNPTNAYLLWVIVYNEREATLNISDKKMRIIK